MKYSVIDIVLVCLGVTLIIIYATVQIIKLKRYRSRVRYLVENEHLTLIQAKDQANQEMYNKKKKNKEQENKEKDELYEE